MKKRLLATLSLVMLIPSCAKAEEFRLVAEFTPERIEAFALRRGWTAENRLTQAEFASEWVQDRVVELLSSDLANEIRTTKDLETEAAVALTKEAIKSGLSVEVNK